MSSTVKSVVAPPQKKKTCKNPLQYSPTYMYHGLLEVFAVISSIHFVRPRLVKVAVVVWGHDAKTLFLLNAGALYQLEGNRASRRAVTVQNILEILQQGFQILAKQED